MFKAQVMPMFVRSLKKCRIPSEDTRASLTYITERRYKSDTKGTRRISTFLHNLCPPSSAGMNEVTPSKTSTVSLVGFSLDWSVDVMSGREDGYLSGSKHSYKTTSTVGAGALFW